MLLSTVTQAVLSTAIQPKVGNHRFERASLKSSLYLYWIFKDADALDRFRIASNALDIQFLRTDAAKKVVSFAENLVEKILSLQPVLEQDRYLIVVDMQNDFVTGTLGTEQAREILPFVTKKIKDFPGNIVFTMDSHKEDYLSTQEGSMLPVPHCIAGTHADKTKKEIIEWIQQYFEKKASDCSAIIGISGGKDSSVAAALCAEAIGAERVIGVLMPNGKQKIFILKGLDIFCFFDMLIRCKCFYQRI